MFQIKCMKCGNSIIFTNGENDESKIQINGQVEVLSDADVYIECECGNEINIEKR